MKVFQNAFFFAAILCLVNSCTGANLEKDVNELLSGKYASRVQKLKVLNTNAATPLAKGIDKNGKIKGMSLSDLGEVLRHTNKFGQEKLSLLDDICADLNIKIKNEKKRKTINTLIILRINPNYNPNPYSQKKD